MKSRQKLFWVKAPVAAVLVAGNDWLVVRHMILPSFWATTTDKMLLPCLAGAFMTSIGVGVIGAIAFMWGHKDV